MPPLPNTRHERFAQELAKGKTADEAAETAGLILSDCDKPQGFYVYALCDPRDGRLFYVGKGKGRRYASHYREWRSSRVLNAAKFERIAAIAAEGLRPRALLIEEGLTNRAALELELSLVQVIGISRLTNVMRGTTTEEARTLVAAKDALSRVAPFEEWMREPRTELSINVYHFVVASLKEMVRELEAGAYGSPVQI